MPSKTYTDNTGSIDSDWLNPVDQWTYGPATKTEAKALTPEDGVKIYPQDSDGGVFIGGTGKTAGYYDDDGTNGSYGTKFKPTGGDGSAGWERANPTPVNPTWFGAVEGGTDDISTAFQLALNALVQDPALIDRPGVVFDEGIWRLDTPPTLPAFAITIKGSGGTATLKVDNMVAGSYALTVSRRNVTLEDLQITSSTTAVHGIKTENNSWMTYSNVHITGCGDGWTFEGANDSLALSGLTAYACTRSVVFSTTQSTSLRFIGCAFEKGDRAVDILAQLSDVHFSYCVLATTNAGANGRIVSCDGSSLSNVSFTYNRIENQAGTAAESFYLKGINFSFWAHVTVKYNHFTGAAGSVLNHITCAGNVGGVIDENTFFTEPTGDDIASTASTNISLRVGSDNKWTRVRATNYIKMSDVGTTNYRKRDWRPTRITYDRIQLDCSATGYKTLAVTLSTQTRWPAMEMPSFVSGYELIHVANVGIALLKGQPEVELTTTTATFRYNVQAGAAGTDYVTFDLIVYGY